MIFPAVVEDINSKFENLSIWIKKIEIEKIEDINEETLDKQTASTGIWHQANIVGYPTSRTIVGSFFIIFRNQNKGDFNLALSINVESRVDIAGDEKDAAAINKYIQFLFDWFKEYVKENEIKDATGELFNVPPSHYSSDLFAADFPH